MAASINGIEWSSSIEWSSIKIALVRWAKENSGINKKGRHIWANSKGAQPDLPYVTLKITSGPTKLGTTDELRYNQTTQKFETTGLRQFTLEVNSYGKDSLDIMTRLQLSIEQPEVVEFFRVHNMAVSHNNPVILDVGSLLETVIEERHSMELLFSTSYILETSENYIETVEYASDYDDGKIISEKTIGG
jgi:hypothetical protein